MRDVTVSAAGGPPFAVSVMRLGPSCLDPVLVGRTNDCQIIIRRGGGGGAIEPPPPPPPQKKGGCIGQTPLKPHAMARR